MKSLISRWSLIKADPRASLWRQSTLSFSEKRTAIAGCLSDAWKRSVPLNEASRDRTETERDRKRQRETEKEPEESRLQINPIIPDKTKPNSEISFEVSSRFFPTEQFHGPCSPIMPVFLRQRARFLLNSCRWTPLQPFPSTSVSLSASWLFTLRQYRAVVIPLSV